MPGRFDIHERIRPAAPLDRDPERDRKRDHGEAEIILVLPKRHTRPGAETRSA